MSIQNYKTTGANHIVNKCCAVDFYSSSETHFPDDILPLFRNLHDINTILDLQSLIEIKYLFDNHGHAIIYIFQDIQFVSIILTSLRLSTDISIVRICIELAYSYYSFYPSEILPNNLTIFIEQFLNFEQLESADILINILKCISLHLIANNIHFLTESLLFTIIQLSIQDSTICNQAALLSLRIITVIDNLSQNELIMTFIFSIILIIHDDSIENSSLILQKLLSNDIISISVHQYLDLFMLYLEFPSLRGKEHVLKSIQHFNENQIIQLDISRFWTFMNQIADSLDEYTYKSETFGLLSNYILSIVRFAQISPFLLKKHFTNKFSSILQILSILIQESPASIRLDSSILFGWIIFRYPEFFIEFYLTNSQLAFNILEIILSFNDSNATCITLHGIYLLMDSYFSFNTFEFSQFSDLIFDVVDGLSKSNYDIAQLIIDKMNEK